MAASVHRLVNPNGQGLGPGRVPGKPIPQVREEDVWGATFVRLFVR